jgi:autotransporter-associated beta strand protein
MKLLKTHSAAKLFNAALCASLLAVAIPARAQYETTLTGTNVTENFDGLGANSLATLPDGWVFAQGVSLPNYRTNLTCQAPPFQFIGPTTNNCQNCTRSYDGNTGGSTPTGGGRVNYGDLATATDRAIGFMSLNSSGATDYRSPTNYLMFGFTNNTGNTIASLDVTNNIKMFRQSSSTAFNTAARLYYSYNGINWTLVPSGSVGPFPSGTTTYYFASPIVSNVSLTISGLNITNSAPFYLAWQFVIANASGSFSAGLALDDVELTANFSAGPVATSVWTNSSGNWSGAANWLGSTTPTSGNNLAFAGNGGNSTNNLAAVSTGTGTVGYVLFTNGAGAYTLAGNAVSLTSGLTNNSAATQTVGLPLTLLLDQTFAAANGSLIFNSPITNAGSSLTFAGASNVTLNGFATGNGTLTMSGNGKLLLNGSNSYVGPTTINSGTVQLGGSEKIPDASAVSLASGAALDLNNFSETIASLAGGGNVLLGSATLTLSGGSSSFGGVLSGNGSVVKNGGGTFTVTGTNNYHGTTTVNSGFVAVPATGNFGDSTLVLNGGTFQCTGTRDVTNGILPGGISVTASSIIQNLTSATAGTRNLPVGGGLTGTAGTLTLQNIATGNFTNNLHLRIHGPVPNFSQPIVFDNSLAGNGQTNNTLQLSAYNTNGTAPQLYSGNISGPGKFNRASIVVGAGGTAILTGSNTFTLGTTVSRGFLGLGSDSYSSGGAVIASPVGTGILEITDDTLNGQPGVGIFASGGARTIENKVFLNGTTNMVVGGTNDLTLAGYLDVGGIPKIITVSNTAVTTVSGQFTNFASVTKSGPGLLVLTANNSPLWTGALTISNGNVAANNVAGSATGTNLLTIAGGTLSGTGTVASAVIAAGGSVAPGYKVGVLTLNNGLDLSGSGTLVWTLGANSTNSPGANFSQLALNGGALTLGGSSALTLVFTNAATAPAPANAFWQSARSWRIATLAGGASISGGNFAGISNGTYPAGTFAASTDGSGVLLTFTPGTTSTNPPVIAGFNLSGSTLSLFLTNGSPGAAFQIVTATNLTQASGTWSVATNGSFAGNGTFTNSLTIDPASPQRFYRAKLP